jgi:hypothetical protein
MLILLAPAFAAQPKMTEVNVYHQKDDGYFTIEVSSTTRRPQASVFYSFLLNRPVPGSISSRRWIVFASKPMVSVSRFAARPVGAHSKHLTPLARKIIRIEFTTRCV